MQKVSTAVIIGIVCVILLGTLVFLNRDKFASLKADAPAGE